MEHNKIDWRNWIVKLIIIVMLAFIIYKQVEILTFFQDNKAQLDADPLVYSARYYNIESCGCVLNENVTLHFNKNKSSYLIQKKGAVSDLKINFSIFD
jgi:hypothetical protein